MKELAVSHAEWDADRVAVSISFGNRIEKVSIATSEDLGKEADFLLPLTLFPAMVTGCHLKLQGNVSSRLLSAVPKIQDIFRLWGTEHWSKKYQWVSVKAKARNRNADRASGVACFFSGGLDAFYTLLEHRDEVTHLIFVHGFDIHLTNQTLRARTSHTAREVAKELGKTLIEVETDLRMFSDQLVSWDKYHGAALASIALLFQDRFRKVLIAATNTYAVLNPWGSHPLLDPLWSTELTEIEHDECEATRTEKAAYISQYELAIEQLRVCYDYENPSSTYNCGRCEKCLRTMIDLRIAGALERCKTLPSNIDLKAVANMDLSSEVIMPFARHRLKVLERLGTEPELAEALAEAIVKSLKTSETRTAYKEQQRLQRQLRRSHEQLERNRVRLTALTTRYSSRPYKFVDALVEGGLQIPGIGKLLQKITN
jgi:hypothetical protein